MQDVLRFEEIDPTQHALVGGKAAGLAARAAVRTGHVDARAIEERRDAFRTFAALTPPRVLTSDGEMIAGAYHREAPRGALVGLAVSAGVVEGRARVIFEVADAELAPGDILVTQGSSQRWAG